MTDAIEHPKLSLPATPNLMLWTKAEVVQGLAEVRQQLAACQTSLRGAKGAIALRRETAAVLRDQLTACREERDEFQRRANAGAEYAEMHIALTEKYRQCEAERDRLREVVGNVKVNLDRMDEHSPREALFACRVIRDRLTALEPTK